MAFKNKLIVILFLVFLSAKSQVNIVPNPSFETFTSCPTFGAQWQVCSSWNNVNMNQNAGPWGTPDYFTACGTGGTAPPATFSGTCSVQNGNAMMGLVMYNAPFPDYREYLSSQLICPMIPGNTYTLSFWLSNGTGIKSPYTIRNIGAHFSATPLTQTGWNLINVVPQCEITTNVISTGWTQYTFTVNPTTTWNYITLGCFRTDALNNPTMSFPNPGGPASVYANYFIDNISVLAPASGSAGFNLNAALVQPNFCSSNGSATVSCSNSSLNPTYSWTPGNYTSSTVSNLSPGSYTVTGSIFNGCSSSSASVQITISPAPTLSANFASTAICKNSSVSITATVNGVNGPYSYTWNPGGISSSSIVVSPSVSTIYTLTAMDNNGCSAIIQSSVNIASITASFNHTINSCNGTLLTQNNSSGQNNSLWDFGDGVTSNLFQPSHVYANAGNYTVTLITNSAIGCADTVKQSVLVSAPVQSNFTEQIQVCDSVVFLANNSTGATTYNWSFGDGSFSTLQNPVSHTYGTGGTYNITLISSSANGCSDTILKTVTVIKNSQVGFNIISHGCSNVINLVNTSSLAVSSLWQFGDGNSSTQTSPAYSYTVNGTYLVTLIVNPGTSCSLTLSKAVSVGLGPEADFTYSLSLCNTSVTFTNLSSDVTSCIWKFGDGSGTNIISPSHIYNGNGYYTVTLIAGAFTPCADTIKKTIIINLDPVRADFEYLNPNFTYNIDLKNLSYKATKYFWDFGDGSSSVKVDPTHTYEQMGLYNVCLVAKNDIGCSDTICKNIIVDAGWTFYVPNTFSPDGNNINEIFYAYGTNIKNFKIRVFDRWGEELFYSGDILMGWDGTYKGSPVKPDIYVWKAEFYDYGSKLHSLTGHIQVLK